MTNIPRHVAVIMDGNRRWARARGWPPERGYEAGLDAALRMVEMCISAGVRYLTLYALSSENVAMRSDEELGFIFSLVENEHYMRRLLSLPVRVAFMGDVHELPPVARGVIDKISTATKHSGKIFLTIAINYGGRQEIVRAAKAIAEEVSSGSIGLDDISAQLFEERLYSGGIPDPDFLIRTGCSDRLRLSNFMLWQMAYAELFFSRTMWPDYAEEDFAHSMSEFANRVRRFGR